MIPFGLFEGTGKSVGAGFGVKIDVATCIKAPRAVGLLIRFSGMLVINDIPAALSAAGATID